MKTTSRKWLGWIGLVAILLVIVFVFGPRLWTKQDSGKGVKRVFVNQYVTQPILDAVLAGMQERLAVEGNIEVVVKNSNADAMTCRQINEQFVQQRPDVLVALGTPAAQSAVEVAKGVIPVVFGAITDPVGAGLADSLEAPGGNKTGTTNRWPFDEQVRLIRQLLPQASSVGIIVNPGEENCNAGVAAFREAATKEGLTLVEVPATNSAEVNAAAEVLVGKKVDVILVSPSNTLFSAFNSLISKADSAGIPVIGGDESAVQQGSVATYGFSNKDVGIATAEIILEILKGGKDAGSIPVAKPKQNHLFVNEEALKKANLTIPSELKELVINE